MRVPTLCVVITQLRRCVAKRTQSVRRGVSTQSVGTRGAARQMKVRNSATGPQQHVASQAMAPMFPRLRFGLPNSLVSVVVARRVSEGARRASHDCRRTAHGYLAELAGEVLRGERLGGVFENR